MLALADMVSLAFRLVRVNIRLYSRVLFLPALFSAVASNLAQYSMMEWLKVAAESKLAVAPFAIAMAVILACIVLWFYAAWELCMRCSAMSRFLLQLNASYQEAYEAIKKRRWLIFGVYNLAVLPPLLVLIAWTVVIVSALTVVSRLGAERLLVGGLVFFVIGLLLTVSLAITSLYGALLTAGAVVEDCSFKTLAAKSLHFAKARLLRGASFICLLTVAIMVANFAISSPLTILEAIETAFVIQQSGLSSFSETAEPTHLRVISAMFDVMLNMVTFSVAYTGYVLFFRDLKLRLEATDLVGRLEKLVKVDK